MASAIHFKKLNCYEKSKRESNSRPHRDSSHVSPASSAKPAKHQVDPLVLSFFSTISEVSSLRRDTSSTAGKRIARTPFFGHGLYGRSPFKSRENPSAMFCILIHCRHGSIVGRVTCRDVHSAGS